MRSVRKKLHFGGLAAVVGAATLVLPLLAIDSAEAIIPKADLSITKTVESSGNVINVPSDFNAMSDTRSTGHYQVTGTGLHIWTEGATGTDKVAEYVSTSTPLAGVGEPTLDFTKIENTTGPTQGIPGFQLVVDFDNNGTPDGILVGEPQAYAGNDWWLSNGAQQFVKDGAPSHTGGFGSANHGNLTQWRAAFPNAKVLAYGFSLGSGVYGDGTVNALNFAGQHYTFGSGSYGSSTSAAPGDTLQYKLSVANGSGPDTLAATGVQVTDVLPAELTYVPGSLVDNGNGCGFSGQVLTCNAGTFPAGISTVITFKATLDGQISTAGLPTTQGHWVDVQKQEVFADLPAGQTRSYSAFCPSGYVATDGGLLLDAVDQGGFYSDVVVAASQQTSQGGLAGWKVKATNLGDERAQGKVKVTCLTNTVGSSGGHAHQIDGTVVGGQQMIAPGTPEGAATFSRVCPTGYTPIAPVFDVVSGVAVVRESYADGNKWTWTVDHSDGTDAWYGISCLAPETLASSGHQATLSLTIVDSTISVGPEQRTEGVQQCPDSANAIVGGYAGYGPSVLSLGKEPRGTNYMFRFYNDDWDNAFNADIQVTCVGVRTTAEPTYRHVVNTAMVTTTSNDRNSSDNTSSADAAVSGDPMAPPPSGVQVGTTGTRTTASGKTKTVVLSITCPAACSFTVKVINGGNVVAKATKSLTASPTAKSVSVPTTSAGKFLGSGLVSVTVKTTAGTTTFPVSLS